MSYFTSRFTTTLLLAFGLAAPASFVARAASACECAEKTAATGTSTKKCSCSKKGHKHDCAHEHAKEGSSCRSHEEQGAQHSESAGEAGDQE